MSYSVLLKYANAGDVHVTLTRPTMGELKMKTALYDTLPETHTVQFRDTDDCEIEENDDLQNAFDEHGRHNLVIKVITVEKCRSYAKNPTQYTNYQSNEGVRGQYNYRGNMGFKSNRGLRGYHHYNNYNNRSRGRGIGSVGRDRYQSYNSNRARGRFVRGMRRAPMAYSRGAYNNQNRNNNYKARELQGPWKKLTILPYRWQIKQVQTQKNVFEGKIQVTDKGDDDVESQWIWCSHYESLRHEQQCNAHNKWLPNGFEANGFEALGSFDSFRRRRMTRFEGKVIKILQKQTVGFVEPNYPQQSKSIGVAFYYGDFRNEHINASNPLRTGYKLEYSLKFYSTPPKYAGFRAVDIKIISKEIADSPSPSMAIATAQREAEAPTFEPGQIASAPTAKLNRYIDRVQQVNTFQQRGYIWSTKLNTLLGFDLDACAEIDIEKSCLVEYCVENAKATKVTFVILDYKWREFNYIIKRWNKCTYQQCVDYENMYNPNHLNMESELNLNGKRLKRYTRFEGKIKRLNADKRMGYVQYGVKYNVLFEFDECDFDASFLNEGDMISYKIERDEDENGVPNLKCVTVKFLPITFLWREKAMKGPDEWTNCSVQKSKHLESKYYQRKNKNIIEYATNTKYSRIVVFRGHITQISLSDGTIQFDLDDTYKNIKVDYASQECKNQSLNEGDAVQFKLINTEQGVCKAIDLTKPDKSKRKCGIIPRSDKQIGYLRPYGNVCDDNKVENTDICRERKESPQKAAKLNALQKQWFDGKICVHIKARCDKRASCKLKHVEPHSIKTICFWEIINGFCDAPQQCIYDQHDNINLKYLQDTEAVKYTKDWYYGKLCSHLSFRCNAHCNRIHANPNTVLVACEWERKTNKCKNPTQCIYAFHKYENVGKYADWFRDIEDVVVGNESVNKDKLYNTEIHQNDDNKLMDDEIKQLFYKTVDSAHIQIIDIEEVMLPKQNRLYELSLLSKCDELKKTRDEIEKYVWYGSSYHVSNIIIQNGFDPSYSTVSAYGNGMYFARDAGYTVTGYCPTHSNGYQYILLCKVIVGDSTKGSSSIKKVPLKPNQTEYDTFVDNTSNPSIYVVWREHAAIPVYRIKFKAYTDNQPLRKEQLVDPDIYPNEREERPHMAGPGIYFATSPYATNRKAQQHGRILQADVALGKTKTIHYNTINLNQNVNHIIKYEHWGELQHQEILKKLHSEEQETKMEERKRNEKENKQQPNIEAVDNEILNLSLIDIENDIEKDIENDTTALEEEIIQNEELYYMAINDTTKLQAEIIKNEALWRKYIKTVPRSQRGNYRNKRNANKNNQKHSNKKPAKQNEHKQNERNCNNNNNNNNNGGDEKKNDGDNNNGDESDDDVKYYNITNLNAKMKIIKATPTFKKIKNSRKYALNDPELMAVLYYCDSASACSQMKKAHRCVIKDIYWQELYFHCTNAVEKIYQVLHYKNHEFKQKNRMSHALYRGSTINEFSAYDKEQFFFKTLTSFSTKDFIAKEFAAGKGMVFIINKAFRGLYEGELRGANVHWMSNFTEYEYIILPTTYNKIVQIKNYRDHGIVLGPKQNVYVTSHFKTNKNTLSPHSDTVASVMQISYEQFRINNRDNEQKSGVYANVNDNAVNDAVWNNNRISPNVGNICNIIDCEMQHSDTIPPNQLDINVYSDSELKHIKLYHQKLFWILTSWDKQDNNKQKGNINLVNDDAENDDNKRTEIEVNENVDVDAVRLWLTNEVKLPQYIDVFIKEGYDSIITIRETLDDNDLLEMGIPKKGHRKKIMFFIKKMKK